MSLEERIAKQMNKRLNHIENDISNLRNEIGSLRKILDNRSFWILGILITSWITIILTIKKM